MKLGNFSLVTGRNSQRKLMKIADLYFCFNEMELADP